MSETAAGETTLPSVGPLTTIETCHSTWIFDEVNRRFRRLLKGARLSSQVSTEWRDYDHVVLEDSSDAFLVMLDESGTRLLRSWRHLGGECPRCGEAATQEMSLKDLDREVASREALLD